MPFKIVSTRRRGKEELSTVPSHWENKGKLRWPKYNVHSLCRDENAQPGPDWYTMNCTLKRPYFTTYEDAEEELSNMLNITDTDADNEQGHRYSSIENSTTECPNFNSLAQCLIDSSMVVDNNETFRQNSSSVLTDSNGVIYEVLTEGGQNTVTQQPDSIGSPLLQQIENIYVVQKVIMDNQEKIMKKLSEFSVQLEESLRNREPLVTTLSQSQGMQTKRILIKAIDNIQGLQQLDTELSTPEGFESLQEKYSILCSVQRGNGSNCAYRLLDAVFTKDFLCKCSWTGGSRKADVKIGFKGYKNIIKFFFVMVNSWDNTYTMENNEDFFKTVLRNALKRKDTKNIRLSAPKKRVKKNASNKNNNNENEPKNDNENDSKNDSKNYSNKDHENDSDHNNENGPENNVLPQKSKPQNQRDENRQAQKEEEEDEESLR